MQTVISGRGSDTGAPDAVRAKTRVLRMKAPDSRQSVKFILLAAILLVVPVFIVTSKLSFRLDGDYDAHLPLLNYAIEYIQTHKAFPRINPNIADGMPVAGDPISPLLNPLFTI